MPRSSLTMFSDYKVSLGLSSLTEIHESPGKFWHALFNLVGTDIQFSIAFHSRTNGQSEPMIQTLENFLGPYAERHP